MELLIFELKDEFYFYQVKNGVSWEGDVPGKLYSMLKKKKKKSWPLLGLMGTLGCTCISLCTFCLIH